MNKNKDENPQNENEEIEVQEVWDEEALSVILRLIDKTFKDLVYR